MSHYKQVYGPLGPLDAVRKEIRLLEILPAQGNDDDELVSVRLFKASLRADLAYAALSYVWGTEMAPRAIMVNGVAVPATRSLEAALRRFRASETLRRCGSGLLCAHSSPWYRVPAVRKLRAKRDPSARAFLPLWADALCINQDDFAERGAQVLLMREIYSSATAVVSWLGESERLGHALNCIRYVTRGAVADSVAGEGDAGARSFANSNALDPETAAAVGDGDARYALIKKRLLALGRQQDPRLAGLHELAESPYWGRVWIFQEVASARSAHANMFVCGGRHASYAEILALLDWRQTPASWDNPDVPFIPYLPTADIIADMAQQQHDEERDPWNALYLAKYGEATNPRDMVYGVRGLLFPDALPPVDYAKTVRQVYLEWAAIAVPAAGGNIGFLLLYAGCGLDGAAGGREHEVPSWMPQLWRMRRHWEAVGGARGQPAGAHVNVPLLRREQLPAPEVCEAEGALRVHGIVRSRVARLFRRARVGPRNPERESFAAWAHGGFYALCVEMATYFAGTGGCRHGAGVRPGVLLVLTDMVCRRYHSGSQSVLRELLDLADPAPRLAAIKAAFRDLFCGFEHFERDWPVMEAQFYLDDRDRRSPCPRRDAAPFTDRVLAEGLLRAGDWHFGPLSFNSWTFFQTAENYLGVGPLNAKEGDHICLTNASRYPLILRQAGDSWLHVGTGNVPALHDHEETPDVGGSGVKEYFIM
ncbi:heterokaryon incompatibility protein-domain-containing protein [Xylariomycetidae sp. FL0641]|nr:heterokaryon incompatibility protein-domain-containing protein [Xylariomycetidae sp. FL0641]